MSELCVECYIDLSPLFQIGDLLWVVVPIREVENVEMMPDSASGTITSALVVSTTTKVAKEHVM